MTTYVERELVASDVLRPAPGELIEVLAGTALCFASDSTNRRIPLTQVQAGASIVGCLPAHGGELIVTGVPGTRVRLRPLDDDTPVRTLQAWLRQLGESSSRGHLPRTVRGVRDLDGPTAADQDIIGEPDAAGGVTFVQVQQGAAYWCGMSDADVIADDPPFPLPRSSWLNTGEGCELQVVAPPVSPAQWSAPLALAGHSALAIALQRQHETDAAAAARRRTAEIYDVSAVTESVDTLASSIGGAIRIPQVGEGAKSADFAAAALVALHDGLTLDDASLERAVREVETGRAAVEAIADAVGARPRTVTLQPDWRQHEGSGLIARVRADEPDGPDTPIALVWHRGWHVAEPGPRHGAPVDDALAARLRPEATELVPVLPSTPVGLGQLRRLVFRPVRGDIRRILFTSLLIAGLAFLTPWFIGQLATLFTSNSPTSSYVGLFIALFLVVLVSAAWQAVRSISMLRARSRSISVANGSFTDRIIREPARWHADRPLGQRMTMVSAPRIVSSAVPDDTVARVLDILTVAGGLTAVATTSLPLTAAVAGVVLVQGVLLLALTSRSAAQARRRLEASSESTGRLLELLRGVNRLKIAGADSRAFLNWAHRQARLTRADQAVRKLGLWQSLVIALVPGFGLLVLIAVTSSTDASFASFVTAQTALGLAVATVASASVAMNSAVIAREALAKAKPLLESDPEGGGSGNSPGLISGGLSVKDLVFRYDDDLPPVLDHVSFDVKPGENLAIVGPSGCGKSTLLRILLGLDDAESGTVLVDGKDLASLDKAAVRRQIGSVLQSSLLLPGPIRFNVDLGRGLTTSELWNALDQAAVEKDVRAMALGLDTPVSDGGGTVSGGQRQRILIARALAGRPRMLVFDEATSALDNVTQAAVVESLEQLQLTRIIVAHRLSTIARADRILVMDRGRIVDEGTFDELLARPGLFRDLAMRQQVATPVTASN